jgi:hypothetical protein
VLTRNIEYTPATHIPSLRAQAKRTVGGDNVCDSSPEEGHGCSKESLDRVSWTRHSDRTQPSGREEDVSHHVNSTEGQVTTRAESGGVRAWSASAVIRRQKYSNAVRRRRIGEVPRVNRYSAQGTDAGETQNRIAPFSFARAWVCLKGPFRSEWVDYTVFVVAFVTGVISP